MGQALHHHYQTQHYTNTLADVVADSADGYTPSDYYRVAPRVQILVVLFIVRSLCPFELTAIEPGWCLPMS